MIRAKNTVIYMTILVLFNQLSFKKVDKFMIQENKGDETYSNRAGIVFKRGKKSIGDSDIQFLNSEEDKKFIDKTSFFTWDRDYFTFHGVLLYKQKLDYDEDIDQELCTFCLESFSMGLV